MIGKNLPGLEFTVSQGALVDRKSIYLGIQRKDEAVDLVRGDAARAVFQLSVDVIENGRKDLEFRGPFVHARRGKEFLYL